MRAYQVRAAFTSLTDDPEPGMATYVLSENVAWWAGWHTRLLWHADLASGGLFWLNRIRSEAFCWLAVMLQADSLMPPDLCRQKLRRPQIEECVNSLGIETYD